MNPNQSLTECHRLLFWGQKKSFLGLRQVIVEDGIRKINRISYANVSETSWLTQRIQFSAKYISGPNLEQLALESRDRET